eukprot:TRINITY_DN14847_c0_g1_i1.p1 TRINITY_DN14847_c0_g1~~TRINITY_DN14847_c0_g1_i1.p1  ORF type:complete len:298 (-),score=69.21 TRINITY_DN14847_c0_g1_i1:51-944(-)
MKDESGCPFETPPKKGIDIAEITETPSEQEYKKLKRTMGVVTKFYVDGTSLKKSNFETMVAEIKKLDLDVEMLDKQRAILLKPEFKDHPRQKKFIADLDTEREHMLKQRKSLADRQKQYENLYKWSEGINKICEWLELSLDDYCINDLKLDLKKEVVPPPHLAPKTKEKYSRGLDEIYHNLEESQDFFLASVDGRLHKFHEKEKEMIEQQLEIVRSYSEDSQRRQIIEAELERDLEFVTDNMTVTPNGQIRREKMMKAHAEFFKVLKYFKKKLVVLPDVPEEDKNYDPTFDIWFYEN